VRKNAVNISDAFDMPDRYLCSVSICKFLFITPTMFKVIGRRDGQIYDGLWQWAQENPLNAQQVPDYHHETIGKMMAEARMHSKI
jgi:hypothetical protein